MFNYNNRLMFPINKNLKKDAKTAKIIMAAIGGYSGELGAALRYFFQSFTMPDDEGRNLLRQIAAEELCHVEILSTLINNITCDLDINEIKENGLEVLYTEHGKGIYPTSAASIPFDANSFAVSGNPIADLNEDLAAEAKAKAVYEYLINLIDDKDILAPLVFLRQREVVHYQRFAELLKLYQKRNY